MNADVTYDLYEEPSRWSRVLIISCAIAVALLALWIFVPHVLKRISPTVSTLRRDVVATSQPDRPIQPITVTTVATKMAATAPAIAAPPATGAPADAPRTAMSSGPDSESSSSSSTGPSPFSQTSTAQDAPVPATNAIAQLPPSAPASVWAPIQASSPPPASAFEADAEPIAQPPMPRVRPRQMILTSSLGIPLPHPRPFIPTETTGSVTEPSSERPDFF